APSGAPWAAPGRTAGHRGQRRPPVAPSPTTSARQGTVALCWGRGGAAAMLSGVGAAAGALEDLRLERRGGRRALEDESVEVPGCSRRPDHDAHQLPALLPPLVQLPGDGCPTIVLAEIAEVHEAFDAVLPARTRRPRPLL